MMVCREGREACRRENRYEYRHTACVGLDPASCTSSFSRRFHRFIPPPLWTLAHPYHIAGFISPTLDAGAPLSYRRPHLPPTWTPAHPYHIA
ncbi:hypothetical protein Y032_0009g707 [Ancylostoma ceylanicum]|uniref:Uncharacterized protein n=1 Tax=Ancylostoma ceylanicum TaxID=53326 RepID=A0A016VK42_9BILA|nr:hypothetical protein Y032_0009g707 [Ancylostoma ceylanicum]